MGSPRDVLRLITFVATTLAALLLGATDAGAAEHHAYAAAMSAPPSTPIFRRSFRETRPRMR